MKATEECKPQDCASCGEHCTQRKASQSMIEPTHELSAVKHVIGVVSGKGGVGKSLITALSAVEMNRRGYRTAILDGDLTGPSIPKCFGLKGSAEGAEGGIMPAYSQTGIGVMSVNLLLNQETDPVVWRGPVIAGVIKQFWQDVIWGEVDYLFVDMPPGTGDVPLTVFQSLPVDGILVVSSPQELVSMIVSKAVGMAKMINIPVLGLVENMSGFRCPDCGKEIALYGESHMDQVAAQYDLPVLARLPFDPKLAAACDKGAIELAETEPVGMIGNLLEALPERKP